MSKPLIPPVVLPGAVASPPSPLHRAMLASLASGGFGPGVGDVIVSDDKHDCGYSRVTLYHYAADDGSTWAALRGADVCPFCDPYPPSRYVIPQPDTGDPGGPLRPDHGHLRIGLRETSLGPDFGLDNLITWSNGTGPAGWYSETALHKIFLGPAYTSVWSPPPSVGTLLRDLAACELLEARAVPTAEFIEWLRASLPGGLPGVRFPYQVSGFVKREIDLYNTIPPDNRYYLFREGLSPQDLERRRRAARPLHLARYGF